MFSLASSNIAQTQGRDPSDRQSHRTTPWVKIIGAAAIALLASANTFASAGEISPRMAQEHHACAVVMGLHQPGDLYDTCIRSLSKTLFELDQARLVSADRSACAQNGFTPGTAAFAVCVVTAGQPSADADAIKQCSLPVDAIGTYLDTPLRLEIAMSRIMLICFFAALLWSGDTVSAHQNDWAQARLACADVGIDPGSGAFGQCVVNLYYSLWNEQYQPER